MKESSPSSAQQHIWFERCGQAFAAPMEQLQEVLSAPALRPLPAGEPALAGLMMLRNWILPVFDPLSLVNPGSPEAFNAGVVLVLGPPGQPLLGLIAERVGKVVELFDIERVSRRVRLPVAFAGEWQSPGQSRMLVVNPAALAAAMGLAQSDSPRDSIQAQSFVRNQNN